MGRRLDKSFESVSHEVISRSLSRQDQQHTEVNGLSDQMVQVTTRNRATTVTNLE